MRLCPSCGQEAAASDRFCPHCGATLAGAPDAAQQQQQAYQTGAQQTRPPVYTAPNPGGYNAPSYTTGVGDGNLPLPRSQRIPGGAQSTGMLMNMMRLLGKDTRMLLMIAVAVIAVIFVIVVVFKIVAWFVGLWWLWLILLIALGFAGQRRRGRGRRLP